MKRIVLGTAAIAVLATSASALQSDAPTSFRYKSNSPYNYYNKQFELASRNDFGMNIGKDKMNHLTIIYGQLSTEKENFVLGIQPTHEIVGGDSNYYEARYGWANVRKNKAQFDAYFYGWAAPEKNREIGLGLGGEWNFQPFDSLNNSTFKLGGKAGLGMQNVKGDAAKISTNVNKLTYVTTESIDMGNYKQDTDITYLDNTYVFSVGLVFGYTYTFNKNTSMIFDYTYRYDNYQFDYKVNGQDIENQLSTGQDNHLLTFGIQYRF